MYVRDRYAGFEVKEFGELTDAELEAYIAANVAAVDDVVEAAGAPDAALANHLIMAPVILARAGVRFALKVHGSDLSYTVLPDLERFRPFAVEAVEAAAGILVGSDHIAERLRQAVDDPAVNAKVALGPPGVDTELFAPLEPADAPGRLRELARDLAASAPTPDRDAAGQSSWDRDPAEAAAAVEWYAAAEGPRVVFVGKLIPGKGVDLLLSAWPRVCRAHPGARLLIAGFGEQREELERLWRDLAADDPNVADSVAFAGRLEHDEVARLMPTAEVLVFPSRHPEAFGMVAAEAAAAGVLPVSAAHSGALEVSRALADGLPPEAAALVSFEVDDGAPEAIADRVNGWLDLDAETRASARAALRETCIRLWSWEGVARSVIAASSK